MTDFTRISQDVKQQVFRIEIEKADHPGMRDVMFTVQIFKHKHIGRRTTSDYLRRISLAENAHSLYNT